MRLSYAPFRLRLIFITSFNSSLCLLSCFSLSLSHVPPRLSPLSLSILLPLSIIVSLRPILRSGSFSFLAFSVRGVWKKRETVRRRSMIEGARGDRPRTRPCHCSRWNRKISTSWKGRGRPKVLRDEQLRCTVLCTCVIRKFVSNLSRKCFFRIFVTHTLVLFAEEICCSNVTRPSPRARVARVDQLERFEKLLDSIYYRRLEHFPSLIRTGLLIYESMKHLWWTKLGRHERVHRREN